MTNTSIIIVNYCTAGLTVNCLASLAKERADGRTFDVVLVDNASPDNSADILLRTIKHNGWGDWVAFVQATWNGGFSSGNNIGIRRVLEAREQPEFILLLNPDTVVKPGAISTLTSWIAEYPNAGVVGGRLLDVAEKPQCSGFRFPSILGELESGMSLGMATRLLSNAVVPMPRSEIPVAVDWVSGACFLIRRSVIDQIGLLDEKFFMYYEEVDFCRRAKRRGWEVWHVPQAQVVHLEGAASGISESCKPRPRYWYESRRRYFAKNHGRYYALAAEFVFLFGLVTWRVRRRVQCKADHSTKHRVSDGWRFVIHPLLFAKTGHEEGIWILGKQPVNEGKVT